MKRHTLRTTLAILTLAAAPAMASDAPVPVNTDGLQRLVAKKVEEHAANGMQSLRRHVWGTFHLHRINIDDVVGEKSVEVAANDVPATKKEYRLATRTR